MDKAPYLKNVSDHSGEASAYWLTTADGMRIRVAHWGNNPTSKGTIFVLPGRSGYIERYGRIVQSLENSGFGAFAIDWRGHGLSQRISDDKSVCHITSYDDYQKDLAAMLEAAQELDLPKPWYLFATSMGAGIGLRAISDGFPVVASVFSAPMWGINLKKIERLIVGPLTWTVGTLGFESKYAPGQNGTPYVLQTQFEDNNLTHDSGMYEYWKMQAEEAPELMIGGPSYGWLRQSLLECTKLAKMESPTIPCITLCGELDTIIEIDAIERRMRDWQNGELAIIPNAKHDIFSETPDIRSNAFEKICRFFESRDQQS